MASLPDEDPGDPKRSKGFWTATKNTAVARKELYDSVLAELAKGSNSVLVTRVETAQNKEWEYFERIYVKTDEADETKQVKLDLVRCTKHEACAGDSQILSTPRSTTTSLRSHPCFKADSSRGRG